MLYIDIIDVPWKETPALVPTNGLSPKALSRLEALDSFGWLWTVECLFEGPADP